MALKRKCKKCGKVFLVKDGYPKSTWDKRVYCSAECYLADNLLTKKCKYCGQKFHTLRSKQEFCSIECQKKYYKEHHQDELRAKARAKYHLKKEGIKRKPYEKREKVRTTKMYGDYLYEAWKRNPTENPAWLEWKKHHPDFVPLDILKKIG